jgi:YtoQ family protein
MKWKIYLSGEIHTNWRDELKTKAKEASLNVEFLGPETDHDLSDNFGATILGNEDIKFWHDHKGAKINSIRIRRNIEDAHIVIVKFGDKYKQWNAAFDAGYAAAKGKSLIVMHNDDHQHALKEIDATALAVVQDNHQVIEILKYVTKE